MAKLETIFDHDVTDDEMLNLFSNVETKEEYLKYRSDPDTEFGSLFNLFSIRGDLKKAEVFLAKVKNPLYRFNLKNVDTI